MSSSQLIRWSGLAAVAGGVSLGIAELVALSFFGYDFRQTTTTGTYAFYSVLIMITGVLLPLGLVGLYVRQSEAAGPLGFGGFVVAFIGTVLVRLLEELEVEEPVTMIAVAMLGQIGGPDQLTQLQRTKESTTSELLRQRAEFAE